MSEGAGGSAPTPFERARALHQSGASAGQVEAALVAEGLDPGDARIAARAARGEAGESTVAPREEQGEELPTEPPAIAPAHPCPKHPAWPVTAPCTRCGTFFCAQCLRDAGFQYRSERCPACGAPERPRVGLAGWLVFPALQLAVSPFVLVAAILQDLKALTTAGIDGRLVLPVTIELLSCLVVLALGLYAAMAFFRRKRRAIGLMQTWYAAGLAQTLLEFGIASWVNSIVGSNAVSDASLPRGVISSVIWLAYFNQSTRVKQTFVVD